jgi:hypothetical protein
MERYCAIREALIHNRLGASRGAKLEMTEDVMAKTRQAAKILVNGLNLTPVFKGASVTIDRGLRMHFSETRKALSQLERARKAFEDAMKDLESQDKLGNFEIQDLMSAYNQMETLASTVAKKLDDTINCILNRI